VNELEMSTKIRVTLMKKHTEKFYGPGVQDLLCGIRVHGSVKDACEAMGLSYTKGRRILRHAEAVLGYSLVTRKQGGRTGGSSTLTPEA
jgi:molybdate transport system regulatory protein